MTDAALATGDVLRQALLQIRDLKARLAASEPGRAEPVAIIGMGLRLPGDVTSPEDFARLLWNGTDAVGEAPADRWPPGTGPAPARHGAFLRSLDRFDAGFFGIAPREAASLDPQQRLLLEVGWEALEDANQLPASLAGSATGVYVGMAASDYGRDLLAAGQVPDAYANSGTAYGTAVGRLSYVLGLQGPSIAVDTACSSSLVAVHLAAGALRAGECDLALAGGVNVMLAPEPASAYAQAGMLSPTGRCRSFSADADGYVRGEGCALVVLRRLRDAVGRGDRILGVIRGSATNQDGRSAGLTVPNGAAQTALVAAALKAGGVDPLEISYVEAHGTGTKLGDPIEVAALGRALCAGRPASAPLTIGSVKTNIGHLESAAGVAGLAKVLLAFERAEIPPNLHFTGGNPHVDWDGLPVRVAARPVPWPKGAVPRRAGVSSFGFGGSNAHLVLEEPPARPAAAEPPPPYLLILSARDGAALRDLGQRYLALLSDDAPVGAICRDTMTGRSQFAHRLAVVAGTAAEMRAKLAAALAEQLGGAIARKAPLIRCLPARAQPGEDAVLALRRLSPAFAAAMEAEPAGDAYPRALAALWLSWGIAPTAASEAEQEADWVDVAVDGGGGTPDLSVAVLAELGRVWCRGVGVDWPELARPGGWGAVRLPTYPFQRDRHWATAVRAYRQPAPAAPEQRTLVEQLTTVPPALRRKHVVERLRAVLSDAGPSKLALPVDVSLAKAGVDVLSQELRRRIEGMSGLVLTPNLLLNCQTLNELADHILARMAKADG